jgi:hypothetical protein
MNEYIRTKVTIDKNINAISTAFVCRLMKLRNRVNCIRVYEQINTNPRPYAISVVSMNLTMEPLTSIMVK